MSLPRVSVLILTWNGIDLLRKCLPSVVASTYANLEVIVVDNGSTDGSAEWLAETFPAVRLIRHDENLSFCKGYNRALPLASGDYLLLLNNDVEVPSGWLEPLVERMEREPNLGAVQPKLLQYDRRDHFEYAGGSGGFLDRFGYPFTRGRILYTMEPDGGQYDDPIDIFWATGAAILLRASALERTGLLDERFVLHMEEIDLCWRLYRAGYRVSVEPSSEAYHLGGATLPQGSPAKTYHNFRNSLLMLYKHLSPREWRRVARARALLDGVAIVRALVTFNPAEAGAIVRAFRDAHRMKAAYRDQRPASDEETVALPYRGSILADYFLRGRKRFDALPRTRFIPLRPAPRATVPAEARTPS